jgi:hypothetical protein
MVINRQNFKFAPSSASSGVSSGMIWTLSGVVLAACSGGTGTYKFNNPNGVSGGERGGGFGGGSAEIFRYTVPVIREADSTATTPLNGDEAANILINYKSIRGGNGDLTNGLGGDDWIFSTDDHSSGGFGDDISIGNAGGQEFFAEPGDDAIFSGEGASDNVHGGAGNDILVTGNFFAAELDALRTAINGDGTLTRDAPPFIPRIDLFDLPLIEATRTGVRGNAGDDLIVSYGRAGTAATVIRGLENLNYNFIYGDEGSDTPSDTDGNDFIIAHSNSRIVGGGGDDIFWLRPDQAGDVFTIVDYGTENSGAGAVGDRFLIVRDETTFADTAALYTAIGWVVATGQDTDSDNANDDIRITVTATIGGVANQEYTIDLQNYNTALTLDDFLILTPDEARVRIGTFDAGPEEFDFFTIYDSLVVREANYVPDDLRDHLVGDDDANILISHRENDRDVAGDESHYVDGLGGDDWIFTSGEGYGQGGDDIIISGMSTRDQSLWGGAGNDAVFGSNMPVLADGIRGHDGNDLLAYGNLFADELAALRKAVEDDTLTQEAPPFIPKIDFFNLPDIASGRVEIRGNAGDDLIFSYARTEADTPHFIYGDELSDTSSDTDGNDFIIAHSNSRIVGGGGDDIFWLRPDQAGDVFTIIDFGTENSGQGAVGDRFLIVSDQDFTTVGALYTAIGWVVATGQDTDGDDADDDIRITVTTTIGTATDQEYTIDLQNYNTALTLDDFLIMTEAETEAYIRDLDVGPQEYDFFPDIL